MNDAGVDMPDALSDMAVLWQAPSLLGSAPRAVADFEEIERCAREEGFARGHADGFAQGEPEVRRLVARLQGLLDAFTRPLAELDREMEEALARLAVAIAGGLTRATYIADPTLLAALVHEALACIGEGERQVDVRVHPDDLTTLRPLLSDPTRLTGDVTLARGDVRVHAENIRIDARLNTRLQSVLETLQANPA